MNKSTALLVVDVQNLMLVGAEPYRRDGFLDDLAQLIGECRANGVEVIYVRHDDGPGSELEKGTAAWEIHDKVKPLPGERIVDKEFNSAFVKTDLKTYLDQQGIRHIILTGMQTEYCMDATCKSAFEHGFQITVPEGTNTTFDNEYMSGEMTYRFYTFGIWKNRFAKVMPLAEVIQGL